MSTLRKVRRSASRRITGLAAGALAVAALAAMVQVLPAAARDGRPVEGAYLIDVRSAINSQSFQIVGGFATGGVYTQIESDGPGAAVGQWALKDGHTVVGTFYSYAFDPHGALVGTVKVHFAGQVIKGGTITGTYEATGTTPTGGEFFPPDHGTFDAHRIKTED
jgi:hypothetical protein